MRVEMDDNYPRPDFVRSNLTWTSLNGRWDFIFDDADTGLQSQWPRTGLPQSVNVDTVVTVDSQSASASDAITAKIAANPDKLIQGNLSQKQRSGATTHHKRDIIVPYVFQCPASGINERDVHEVLWYERFIGDVRKPEEKEQGHRVLLRFGAVDYEATVWVNGQFVGSHRGGHVPFDIDITDVLNAGEDLKEHRVTIRVYDSAYDLTQPRGKQYWGAKPESIFYTPSGGIWQSVWLESVPWARLGDSSYGTVLRGDDIEHGVLHADVAVLGRRAGHTYAIDIEASFQGEVVAKSQQKNLPRELDNVVIDLPLRLSKDLLEKFAGSEITNDRIWKNGLALWSPEHPQLYTVTLQLYSADGSTLDSITTTTGMRSISWTSRDSDPGAILLNGHPIFQILCLDQGYWPETFMTPPTTNALRQDIQLAKQMGFNGCRKHQKLEDPIFLYHADREGYLVWGEMANAYAFSAEYAARYTEEWTAAVKRDINHPSIITWTPVNESWAYTDLPNNETQRNHIKTLFYATKTLDATRPINDNCGWEHVCTDLTTFHDYADSDALAETCASLSGILSPKAGRNVFAPGARHVPGAPVICTEFGGVNIAPASAPQGQEAEHTGGEWGYTTAADPEDLLKRVEKLVKAVVPEQGGHCCGIVWTQLCDIEQETNGLYDFERREKLDARRVKNVFVGAEERYLKSLKG